MLLKFGENRLIHAEIYELFSKFKMAAAVTLDFENFAYLTQGINTSWYQVYAVKIW